MHIGSGFSGLNKAAPRPDLINNISFVYFGYLTPEDKKPFYLWNSYHMNMHSVLEQECSSALKGFSLDDKESIPFQTFTKASYERFVANAICLSTTLLQSQLARLLDILHRFSKFVRPYGPASARRYRL